ncbi:MAG: DoxX family protein [Mucilaginibacter sp.]|uniref:DoxX family protein n=1 Tax=Mucilaginibacter sp. TaxID=1882438 RepID=UPI0031A616D9
MSATNVFSRKFLPVDSCLLFLRLATAIVLFSKHGYEKIFHFQEMLSHFPDPIGIGKLPGLIYATITDACCTLLLALGLFSRVAVVLLLSNLLVAFIGVHQGAVNDHGELMILYMINLIFLFFTGPGRISFDYRYLLIKS